MMRRDGSRRARLLASMGLLGLCAGFAWLLAAGCRQGQGPTASPQPNGSLDTFLPPGGVALGTSHRLGLIYHFDTNKYQLYFPIPGTDPKFIRRDSVLAKLGANIAQRTRPDTTDATLDAMYKNPKLFGFVGAADPSQVGFAEGTKVADASQFYPLGTTGQTWWKYNHNQLEWTRADTIIGSGEATTAGGMTVIRVRTTCEARADLRGTKFKPGAFSSDLYASADPLKGIFWHRWSLISERVVPPADRGGPRGEPPVQRNPRGLWLSVGSLGFPDPTAPVPNAIDQCLDGMLGSTLYWPLQLSGKDFQEGDIYTTFTYLTVDAAELQHRVNEDGAYHSRCHGLGGFSHFPTGTFTLLCEIEVDCERTLDQLVWVGGQAGANAIVGKYGRIDAEPDVVKLDVTMSITGLYGPSPVQYLELYLLRGVGEVVQRTGVFATTRSTTRLQAAVINNVPADQIQEIFYAD